MKDEEWAPFLSALPSHDIALELSHNAHRIYYQTVEQYIESSSYEDYFISAEEKARAIAIDQLWELRWYPVTAIGFNILCASSLLAILNVLQVDA